MYPVPAFVIVITLTLSPSKVHVAVAVVKSLPSGGGEKVIVGAPV